MIGFDLIFLDYELQYQTLWYVGALLTLIGLVFGYHRHGIRASFLFPNKRLKGLKKGWRVRCAQAPFFLRLFALIALLIALGRPQVPQEETADVEGIDIVVAFDLSGSMASVDLSEEELIQIQNEGETPPNRFKVATDVLKQFIQSRQHDRVSLVVFGKDAFLQFPLTLDYGVMLKILDQMELGDIDGSATVIGNALAMSLARLKESEAKTKLIILLTDGEDNGSNISPMQLAEEAQKREVSVFPILVGTDGQSWQPTEFADPFTGQRKYQPVENAVNPALLEKIAQTTKGTFYRATDQASLEEDFQDILNTFEKSRLVDYAVAERTEIFPYFIWFSLMCILLELILSQVIVRRFP
jgi:Ca-activated chloride channel family protein